MMASKVEDGRKPKIIRVWNIFSYEVYFIYHTCASIKYILLRRYDIVYKDGLLLMYYINFFYSRKLTSQIKNDLNTHLLYWYV